MNCPICKSETREVWMTYSSFQYCDGCKEDVAELQKRVTPELEPRKGAEYPLVDSYEDLQWQFQQQLNNIRQLRDQLAKPPTIFTWPYSLGRQET